LPYQNPAFSARSTARRATDVDVFICPTDP
jgi:hypothetical protein